MISVKECRRRLAILKTADISGALGVLVLGETERLKQILREHENLEILEQVDKEYYSERY